MLLTTVGYGDIVPYTKGGKLFATIYILVAGTILLHNMSMISMIPLELRRRRTELAVLNQFGDTLDDAALRELATGPLIKRLNLSTNHPGGLDECTREMFSLAMLVRLGKVTEEDIKLTFGAFQKLDVNNDGLLNSKSIIAGMIRRKAHHSTSNLAGMASRSMPASPSPIIPQDSLQRRDVSWVNPWNYTRSSGYGSWFDTQSATNEYSPLVPNETNYGLQQPELNDLPVDRYFSS